MDSDPQPSTGAKGWPIHYWQPGLDLKPVLDALADDIGIEALIEGFEMVRPNKLPPASNVGCSVTIARLPKTQRKPGRRRARPKAVRSRQWPADLPRALRRAQEGRREMIDRELDTPLPTAPPASPPPRRAFRARRAMR